MGTEGYFDRIISIWYDSNTKHTPTLKRDMKECIRQFEVSKAYDEISKDRILDLTNTFNKIRKEVYE